MLTAPFLYCFLCFGSPVSFRGSHTKDEPNFYFLLCYTHYHYITIHKLTLFSLGGGAESARADFEC